MLKKFIYRTADADGQGGGGGNGVDPFDAVVKSVEEIAKQLGDAVKPEEVASLKEELAALKTSHAEMKAADVDAKILAINSKTESMFNQLIELQAKSADSADKANNSNGNVRALYSKKSVEDYVKGVMTKSGKHLLEIEEVKAAETFGIPQSFVTGTGADTAVVASGYQLVPGLVAKRRKTNIMLDYFPIQNISVPYLIYLEKIEIGTGTAPNNGPGSAAWIESGEAKPKRSFRIQAVRADAKKLAIFGTIEDCLLMDIPSFDNWIRTDFQEQLDEVANNGLLRGNPAVNAKEPTGLITNASQYVVTLAFDETVTAANYIDAIIAAAASMVTNSKYAAERVFVSRDVWFRIIALKGTDERYLNNPLVYVSSLGELYIAGVHVVAVDAGDVPSTHLLMVGADLGFRILRYGNAGIETGLNGTDFQEDKTSYRGWRRYITYFPSNTRGSVIYDTFANIIALIEAPAEV